MQPNFPVSSSDSLERHGLKIYGTVTVGAKGQVVIPKEIRDIIEIQPGDSLIVVTKHSKAIGLIKADDLQGFLEYIKEEISC